MAKTVQIKVRLHPIQRDFHHSTKLYRAFCGGRGTGKTTIGAIDLIRRARRGSVYMVVGPTFQNMRDSSLRTFLKVARGFGVLDPAAMKLSAPPHVVLSTGAEILFRSADDPERLRGPSLAGAWLDEASLMTKDVYDIVIAALRDEGRNGWMTATFTPKGPTNWTYEVFAGDRPNTKLFRAKTRDNPFNPPGFSALLAQQYGDSSFARQELEGEFVQVEGATFPAEWFADILAPAWPAAVLKNVLYLDPSQGRDSKTGDAQAYCRAGLVSDPSKRNVIYLDCRVNKEPPPDMVARGVRLCRELRPDLWAYETNGTLGLLESEVGRQLGDATMLVRTCPVANTDPKRWRIRAALMLYLSERRVRIVDSPGGRVLRAQLMDEPHSEHDDAADAAAGAITELENLVL